MSTPATPYAMPSMPTGAGSAVDYGPVGTPPTAPGVLYFPATNSAKYGWIFGFLVGSVMFLLGTLVAIAVTAYALVLACVGAGLAFLMWRFGKNGARCDYLCDGYGLTRRVSDGQGPKPAEVYPWSKVTGLDWTTRTERRQDVDSDSFTNYTVNEFHIRMQAGPGISFTEGTLMKMAGLLHFVDAHTPQLSYRWVPVLAAQGLPVDARVGNFVKVPR
jgi:hypothetical protein